MTDDTLTVDGVTVRVTRYGLDKRGRAHFELAGDDPASGSRDVFPTDRGYLNNGRVYMLTPATAPADASQWVWTEVGAVGSESDADD